MVDGEPVASSTLVYGGRVAGVHNVATLPEARRRGFGEALTWHAMARGASFGCDMAALQASQMGRPVYERMGFRLVSQYRTFQRPQ
jgi:predicted acetyltransferase